LEFVKFYEADFELAAAGRSRPVAAESSSEALVLELLEEVTSVRQQIVVVQRELDFERQVGDEPENKEENDEHCTVPAEVLALCVELRHDELWIVSCALRHEAEDVVDHVRIVRSITGNLGPLFSRKIRAVDGNQAAFKSISNETSIAAPF